MESKEGMELLEEIQKIQGDSLTLLQSKASSLSITAPALKACRTLKGHFGKVNCVSWAGDSEHVISSSEDGNLIVWNAKTSDKVQAIPTKTDWIITTVFNPSARSAACGGMNNIVYIHPVDLDSTDGKHSGEAEELVGHEGYISALRFLDESRVASSSGDKEIWVWDIKAKKPAVKLVGHDGDVNSLALYDDKTLVSGSVDKTVKLWDLRDSKKPAITFYPHTNFVNSVDYNPSSKLIVSGSEDSTGALLDVRSVRIFNRFDRRGASKGDDPVTSVRFSKTGRIVFAGYENGIEMFDSLSSKSIGKLGPFDNKVSSLDMSPDGQALCSGSWDQLIKVWA